MRFAAILLLVGAAVASIAAAKEAGLGPFDSGLNVTLKAPTGLHQTSAAGGWSIRPGEWMRGNAVRLSISRKAANPSIQLQAELAANGSNPSGNPTTTGAAGAQTVRVGKLADGSYRWWARLHTGSDVSPWVGYSSGIAFGIDGSAPTKPTITSPTDPNPSTLYRSGRMSFNWHSTDRESGIEGYWYQLVPTSTHPPAHFTMQTRQASLALTKVATGEYQFLVAARDRAGNWSKVGSYPVQIDSTPPTVTRYGFSTFAFNPYYGSMTMNFVVDWPSKVRVGIYAQTTNRLVKLTTMSSGKPNELMHVTWHGRDSRGKLVGAGFYTFYVRATDSLGNTSVKSYSGLGVMYKRIVVSLSQQRLWAYDGSNQVVTSLVTTGNPALPTPTGHFSIMAKYHPFTFISPFPKGAWDYYPPSPVSYAMLFRQGGYYIHDAPWRSVFGPGSNQQTGAPGQNYTGTHGCINVPPNISKELFAWAPDGTPVIVKH